MAARRGQVILVALLVGLAVSLWRTVSVERDRHKLSGAYEQSQQLVAQLTQERTHLNAELSQAKQTMESQAGSLSNLQLELTSVQARLDDATSRIALLQDEQQKMHGQNAALTAKLDAAMAEKGALEVRLSSIKELKLAIRDVRRKHWNERWADYRARAQSQRDLDQEQLASGNRGFVVKQGRSTLSSSPRLQVHVLEPAESR